MMTSHHECLLDARRLHSFSYCQPKHRHLDSEYSSPPPTAQLRWSTKFVDTAR